MYWAELVGWTTLSLLAKPCVKQVCLYGCRLYNNSEGSIHHMLWEYESTLNIWRWLTGFFCFWDRYGSFHHDTAQYKGRCQYLKQLWIVGVMSTMVTIWRHRNSMVFDDVNNSAKGCKHMIHIQLTWTVHSREDKKIIVRWSGWNFCFRK